MSEFLRSLTASLARRWVRTALAVVVAVAMFATLVSAERRNSHTLDEPGHLVRGLAFWWTADRAIHWPHPPIGQAVATAGAAAVGWDHRERIELDTNDFRKTTYHYAKPSYADLRHELTWARYGMAGLASLLGLAIFAWCRRWYDEATGWFALLLYATNTLILAHAGLITTDFPIAAASVVAIMAVNRHLEARTKWDIVLVALAVGLLAVTKISGLLIAAILAVPVLVFALRGKGPYAGEPLPRRLGLVLAQGLGVLVVIVLCINAAYLFQDTGMTVGEIIARGTPKHWFRGIDVLGKDRWIDRLPDEWRIPLPWSYLFSVDFILAQGQQGQGGWFLGESTRDGYPGYFVILLAAKLPLAVMGMLAAGIGIGAWRRRVSWRTWMLVFFVAALLVATYDARINIGVRHVLPVVPVLSILAGRAAALLWIGKIFRRGDDDGPRWAKGIAALACVSAIAGAAMAYPHYVADFNLAVGGRKGGHEISVVGEDWGQDLVDLADYVKRERIESLGYVKMTGLRAMELDYLSVPARQVSCPRRGKSKAKGIVAVHLIKWMRTGDCQRWLSECDKRAVVNDHILVFDCAR